MRLATLFSFVFLSFFSHANWQLDNDKSQVNFVSVKKNTIGETHYFEKLHGKLNKQGKVKLVIDLASVNTAIPIRDERMKQYLFETETFAKATFKSQVDIKAIKALGKGEMMSMTIDGVIDLHGQQQQTQVMVNVVKLGNGDLLINNVKPVLLYASQFGLTKGVMKLQELAGLPSISPVVPVNFSLYYAQ